MKLNLREQFELRNGPVDDGLYHYILDMAMEDQSQYFTLTETERRTMTDPARFPPSNHETEHLDEIRGQLLDAMGIIANMVNRSIMRTH